VNFRTKKQLKDWFRFGFQVQR